MLRICHVTGFVLSRPMDFDAAGLLARTHATLLRGLSCHAHLHFDQSCVASFEAQIDFAQYQATETGNAPGYRIQLVSTRHSYQARAIC